MPRSIEYQVMPMTTRLLYLLGFVVISALIWVGVKWYTQYHVIALEPMVEGCLPWRAYILDIQERSAERYRLVYFRSKGMQPFVDDGYPIGKMVVGVAGDSVRIESGKVYINQQYLADVSYGASRMQKPMTAWDTSYVIPKGKIFVFGTEKKSWDSRYWGLLDESAVLSNFRPLF